MLYSLQRASHILGSGVTDTRDFEAAREFEYREFKYGVQTLEVPKCCRASVEGCAAGEGNYTADTLGLFFQKPVRNR